MQARDTVKHRITGDVGVIVPTIQMLREDGPLSVIFDESEVAHVVENESDFEITGRYHADPDENGCGFGQGDRCCRFLGIGAGGLTCLRFGDLHWSMVFKSGSAKNREPKRLYPDCKLTQ